MADNRTEGNTHTESNTAEYGTNLMNLSDDVLLHILSNLNSNDLNSLSRTCSRLQQVTSDKSLWMNINYENVASIPPYLFLHENMSNIGRHTRAITITGESRRRNVNNRVRRFSRSSESDSSTSEDEDFVEVKFNIHTVSPENETKEPSGKNDELPVYPLEDFAKMLTSVERNIDRKWLRVQLLNPLAKVCPELRTLQLQYLRLFYYNPPVLPRWDALTKLSLRGSSLRSKTAGKHGPLYDLSVKLPNLICLDIGCCSWVESHCFMAISKFENLRTLLSDGCSNLGNCVAYTSLAACLGFPTLEEIDLRDTQFGDSDLLSFKRNTTIKKVVLGRQVKFKTPQHFSKTEEENADGRNIASSSGTQSPKQLNDLGQGGRKRKSPDEANRSGRKRIRLGAAPNPSEAIVIQVDPGLGIRVERMQEAGEYDWLMDLENSVDNMVTDDGIISLGIDGLPSLEYLVLAGSGSGITDRSLSALKKRMGLKCLDVKRTRVTKSGCESFVESCPDVHLHCDFNTV